MLRRTLAVLALIGSASVAKAAPDIVVLGEVHDNADAHLGQAAEIRSLQPTAVVFEMLSPEDAAAADADSSKLPEIWARGNWYDYAIYAPLFEALGEARIVGAATPRPVISQVYQDGAAAHFGEAAVRFGLDQPLDPAQQAARVEMQFEAHCQAMPREMMGGMVEVQRYRDAVFAQAALEALERHGPPVAVITGNGHARKDWGVPAVIQRAAPNVTVRSVAFAESEPDAPYDAVTIVPPAERDDPCLVFKKKKAAPIRGMSGLGP